jgi:hypothetical protein
MPKVRDTDSPELDQATIGAQVARESDLRARLGVPAAASGVLYLLSGIILNASLSGLPTVGVLQGLAPALRGEPNPAVSPRAAEVRFVSHHAFGLIAGSLLQAVALVFLVVILLFLLDAVRFRRAQITPIARPAVLVGGLIMALVVFGHQVAQAIAAHDFVSGHDFTGHATEQALTQAATLQVTTYLGLLAGVSLTVGMVIVALSASRVGLITRWMMYLGIIAAVLAFTPFGDAFGFVQELIPAFWLVAIGFLFMKRLPNDPPAWASGEAKPWPSQTEMRARQTQEREGKTKDKRAGKDRDGGKGTGDSDKGAGDSGKGAAQTQPSADASPANGDVAPEPAQPAAPTSRRRRRKRSARR